LSIGAGDLETELARNARKYALLNSSAHDGRANVSSVIGRMLAERPDLKNQAKLINKIAAVEVRNVNSLSLDEQKVQLQSEFPGVAEEEIARKKSASTKDSERKFDLPELRQAVPGEVVTRFPPEPNGFMHIGHAKAAIIGSEYSKKYNGKFILRFDDTNPAAERKEYYTAFLEAFDWLRIKPDQIRNSSDDMEKFYELARDLIFRECAYVCSCSQEEMRKNRGLGIECSHRKNLTVRNLELWKLMVGGEMSKSGAVLRFKGDMQSANTTMRDPVLFRIVDEPHPIQGTKYSTWPTYDFDGPVEDSLDGVTHAMRSKEYELRDELYLTILSALEMRQPEIIEFSRLSLQNTTVSKRSLKKLIEEGLVEGWDDPRLPTIFGLRRRGFLPQTLREFILQMGVSKVESEPTWDLLESINRKLLDPISKRYFFVPNPVPLEIKGLPDVEVTLNFHPEKDYGRRRIKTKGRFMIPSEDSEKLHTGSKFRLIEAYDVEVQEVNPNRIVGRQDSGSESAKLPKIQWVSSEENVEFKVVETGPLLLNGNFNPDSLKETKGLAEASTDSLTVGDIVQFVRFGFCRVDRGRIAILAHK